MQSSNIFTPPPILASLPSSPASSASGTHSPPAEVSPSRPSIDPLLRPPLPQGHASARHRIYKGDPKFLPPTKADIARVLNQKIRILTKAPNLSAGTLDHLEKQVLEDQPTYMLIDRAKAAQEYSKLQAANPAFPHPSWKSDQMLYVDACYNVMGSNNFQRAKHQAIEEGKSELAATIRGGFLAAAAPAALAIRAGMIKVAPEKMKKMDEIKKAEERAKRPPTPEPPRLNRPPSDLDEDSIRYYTTAIGQLPPQISPILEKFAQRMSIEELEKEIHDEGIEQVIDKIPLDERIALGELQELVNVLEAVENDDKLDTPYNEAHGRTSNWVLDQLDPNAPLTDDESMPDNK